eukprot:m.382640 g.382640  ORF g.382640 m.382640 type:complete len:124 (+) comp16721_c1_seq31:848-1219(+)
MILECPQPHPSSHLPRASVEQHHQEEPTQITSEKRERERESAPTPKGRRHRSSDIAPVAHLDQVQLSASPTLPTSTTTLASSCNGPRQRQHQPPDTLALQSSRPQRRHACRVPSSGNFNLSEQ